MSTGVPPGPARIDLADPDAGSRIPTVPWRPTNHSSPLQSGTTDVMPSPGCRASDTSKSSMDDRSRASNLAITPSGRGVTRRCSASSTA